MEKPFSPFKLIALAFAAAFLVGCGSGGSDRVSRSAGTDAPDLGQSGGGAASGFPATCSNGSSAAGSIYDGQNNAALFEQAAKDLVSASMNPSQLGRINESLNDNEGIDLYVRIKQQADGSISLSESRIHILIFDSYVNEAAGIPAYPITIRQASSGGMNAQGLLQITFQDSYGSVTLVGSVSGGVFQGNVSFQNFKSYDGSQNLKAGTLGAFSVPSCGVFY